MMEYCVTVIVPVYNVEDYLERCIKSIIIQDYSNLEIILVNDGSTDNSGKICDEFQKKDKRIKVLHKENEGLGYARNSAIDVAEGDFLFFVDSDDYIFQGIIREMVERGAKQGADITCCGYKSGKKVYYCEIDKDIVYERTEATGRMFESDGIDANAVCKLYKKSLFENIRYPNCAYEVVPITYQIFLRADKIIRISECGYYIEKRNGSITRARFGNNNLLCIELARDVFEKIKSEYPQLRESAFAYYMNAVISMTEKACLNLKDNCNLPEYSIVFEQFNDIWLKGLKSKRISNRKKMVVLLIKARIYPIVFRMTRKRC